MKVGAIFPQTEFGDDPAAIRDWAQAAEAIGYSHLTVYDHVIGAVHEGRDPKLWGPYTERSPFHEPFVLFGYWAAATQRVELVTGVLILPQRQTVLVAKQAAEVDILSGGRLRLGVGTGWNYVEYEALNEDFRTRGRRQPEQVDLLRRLWREPVLDYTGKYHRIDRAGLLPRPGRQIPIWFGGFGDAAYRRGARLGDGFIFGASVDQAIAGIEQIRGFLAEAGRDPAGFGFDIFVNYQGGPDNWAKEYAKARAAGASHISMRTMNMGLTRQQHLDALQTYWDAIPHD
jgi:probable F420-dependent oxidoreductase